MVIRQPDSRLGKSLPRAGAACEGVCQGSGHGETLPLFAELTDSKSPDVAPAQSQHAVEAAGDKHLRAARRLAKAIRRLPEQSEQQVKTGRAICRHLIALLEGEVKGGGTRH